MEIDRWKNGMKDKKVKKCNIKDYDDKKVGNIDYNIVNKKSKNILFILLMLIKINEMSIIIILFMILMDNLVD